MPRRCSQTRPLLLTRNIFAVLALSHLCLEASAIWPFPPKRFSGNSLISAGSLGVDTDDRVIAFGDFNGDQFLDLLGLGTDQQTLSLYLWNHEDYVFVKTTDFRHPVKVLNAVPGDFTQDGKLDILIMGQGSPSNQLSIDLYIGLPQGGFDLHPVSAPYSSMSQPIPMDMSGDLKIDLFGTLPTSSPDSRFKVWQNVWNDSQSSSPVFNLIDPKMTGAQCKLSNPHSNAAVDLNGDCLADIFLVCDEDNSPDKYYQIWVNHKDDGFSLDAIGRLPRGLQSITFGDVDRDGSIDMLFITCDSVTKSGIGAGCKLNIAFNKQIPTCTSSTGGKNGKSACRAPDNLCVADPNFRFDLRDTLDNTDFMSIPTSSIFSDTESKMPYLLVQDTTHNPPLPLPIKLGDINQDGFPDVLAIVASGTGLSADRTPRIAYSVPCSKGMAGCSSDGKGRRGFEVLSKGGDAFKSVKDARGVAFLDMDEDGTLDVMVQRTDTQGEGNLLFVQNNFYYDAFFLKAIVLNGACNSGLCVTPNGTRYHPFGVSYSGATYKYTVLDTSGKRSAAEVGQLPQTSYHSLLTPYSYFGLGRTNNYIENLFVGSTIHNDQHYIDMEGVIPNSKVVIIPSTDGQGAWRKELYLRPGEWIPWVTLTVVIATVILAIIVLVLHLSEKREDENERRNASHHINFDAL